MTLTRTTKFRTVAVLAPVLAVLPIALDRSGPIWTASHLAGGATALAILAYCGLTLPSPWRWYTVAGVAISITVISVVTGGGSIGTFVQVAVLLLLAAIYVAVVFFPPSFATSNQLARIR